MYIVQYDINDNDTVQHVVKDLPYDPELWPECIAAGLPEVEIIAWRVAEAAIAKHQGFTSEQIEAALSKADLNFHTAAKVEYGI